MMVALAGDFIRYSLPEIIFSYILNPKRTPESRNNLNKLTAVLFFTVGTMM